MAATTRMPSVLARRAHRAGQSVISAGGARRMRAVGGILVIAAEGRVKRIGRYSFCNGALSSAPYIDGSL